MRGRRRLGLAVASIALAAGAASFPVLADQAALGPGPGCDPSRPVVAHHPGRSVITPTPAGGPVACGMSTGRPGKETRIAVAPSGDVVTFADFPGGLGGTGLGRAVGDQGEQANSQLTPGGLTISPDQGATWTGVQPLGMDWAGQDWQITIDQTTGRIFWVSYDSGAPGQAGIPPQDQGFTAHVLYSDDGAHWFHSAPCCHVLPENPRFLIAPAVPGRTPPDYRGGIVYFCGDVGAVLVPEGRSCERSLDGGATWSAPALIFNAAAPVHPECGTSGEKFGPVDGGYPQRGLAGSLYLKVECGAHTFLARSDDEAATFPVLKDDAGRPLEIPTGNELRTDRDGNLYLMAKVAPSTLTMRTSTDGGRTWTPAQDITAPGVTAVGLWFTAVREKGHVAVTYFAHGADKTTYDGYITETRNALAQPAAIKLWSATVNDPAEPLLYSTGIVGAGSGLPNVGTPGMDYMGADIAPGGSPWGSFVEDCGPDRNAPRCVAQQHQTRGFVGRLAWPVSSHGQPKVSRAREE